MKMKIQAISRSFKVFLLIFLCVAANPSLAQDTLLTQIPACKDNTLYEDSTGSLSNGMGVYFFVGRTAPLNNTLRRGVVAFNVTDSIPAGSQIISAQLRLNMSKTLVTTVSIDLHRLFADWGEGTSNAIGNEGGGAPPTFGDATWIHTSFDLEFWNSSGGDYESSSSATTSVSGIGSYSFGSTAQMIADVQLWLDNPDTSFGWILIGDEQTIGSAKRFDTRENNSVVNRPLLVVNYVPPPCCVGIRGDVNNDGNDGNILDLNFLINRIFRSGSAPACAKEADVNSDGNSANILDLNFLVNRIFRNGPSGGPC